jgi:hypothetical protein
LSDAGEEFGRHLRPRPAVNRIDRHSRGAAQQSFQRAAERLGEQRRRQHREGFAQRLQAFHQQRHRKGGVDRERQLRLEIVADGARPRLHGLDAHEHGSGIL